MKKSHKNPKIRLKQKEYTKYIVPLIPKGQRPTCFVCGKQIRKRAIYIGQGLYHCFKHSPTSKRWSDWKKKYDRLDKEKQKELLDKFRFKQ